MTALETANAVLNFAVPLGILLAFVLPDLRVIASAPKRVPRSELKRELARNSVLREQVADLKRELERKRNEQPAPGVPVSPPWVPPNPFAGGVAPPIQPWSAGQGLQISPQTTSNDWLGPQAFDRAVMALKTYADPPLVQARRRDDGEATA